MTIAAPILACVDVSAYGGSVCDHAAWFSGRFNAPVTFLHVDESGAAGTGAELLNWAAARLAAEGVTNPRTVLRTGNFTAVAESMIDGAQLMVLGKRGERTTNFRENLGSNVDHLLRTLQQPVCLVSQYFLPISRALVLLDARPHHRRTVDYIARQPALSHLDLDLVLIDDAVTDHAEKLQWARRTLGAHDARIFSLEADGPDAAAMRYLEDHGYDLLILSREVLLADPDARFAKAAPHSLWASRTPVLVC